MLAGVVDVTFEATGPDGISSDDPNVTAFSDSVTALDAVSGEDRQWSRQLVGQNYLLFFPLAPLR